jgi:hypothetical protein
MRTETTVSPPAVDAEVARLEREARIPLLRAEDALNRMKRIAGRDAPRLTSDLLAVMETEPRAARLLETYRTRMAEREALLARASDAEAPYREHPWSRFFLVTNNNGHIHRRMSCSTCRPSTVFVWLTELSGTDEETAVREIGEILCSVCFPSAPVGWTNGESHANRADREKREAAKAEREAKKDAKRLISGSDEGVVVTTGTYTERLKTVAAAKRFLTDGYENFYGSGPWDGVRYLSSDRDAVAALLLGRPGVKEATVEEILAAAKKRADKRR